MPNGEQRAQQSTKPFSIQIIRINNEKRLHPCFMQVNLRAHSSHKLRR